MAKRPTQAELKARPHKCEHEDQTYRFKSHDALVFHLMRQHLLTAIMLTRWCLINCPMLDNADALQEKTSTAHN